MGSPIIHLFVGEPYHLYKKKQHRLTLSLKELLILLNPQHELFDYYFL